MHPLVHPPWVSLGGLPHELSKTIGDWVPSPPTVGHVGEGAPKTRMVRQVLGTPRRKGGIPLGAPVGSSRCP